MRSTLHPIPDAPSPRLPMDDGQQPSPQPCAPTSLTATVKEVAVLLGVSDSTVYRMVRADAIPYKRVGRRILIPRVELAAWLEDDAPATATTAATVDVADTVAADTGAAPADTTVTVDATAVDAAAADAGIAATATARKP